MSHSDNEDTHDTKPAFDNTFEVFVNNLNFDTSEEELREFFEQSGEIERISMPVFADSGRPKGFAFVKFTNEDSVNNALELAGEELGGRTINVRKAMPKQEGGRGGRGGRGGFRGGRGGGFRGGRGGYNNGGGYGGGDGGYNGGGGGGYNGGYRGRGGGRGRGGRGGFRGGRRDYDE